ncbi:MAG: RnfH family protein [Gammaproteobacteria bacterium]
MRARRVVVVRHSAAEMFALADDILSYPEFLPWCEAAEEARDGEKVRATLHVRYCGLKTSFTTENRHSPPSRIDMRLVAGPLRSLSGGWRFSDLADGRCRVEFALEYQFAPGVLGAVFARMFGAIFGRFVECFVRRAERVSGERIRVTVASAADGEKTLTLAAGATVGDALDAGGYADAESAGVFGRVCGRRTPLSAGDRVEIYRPLANDPRAARRARAK